MNRKIFCLSRTAGFLPSLVIAAVLIVFFTEPCLSHDANIYSLPENWAYFAEGGEDKPADLFLICPTVDTNPRSGLPSGDEYNMQLSDTETKRKFLGALNMERGIYEGVTRMYAPYYRQAAMKVYEMSESEREPYMEIAYRDISAAFAYYLEHHNDGRLIILAGFSQGADMCYRLLQEYFPAQPVSQRGDNELYSRLVAVYAIGWPCSDEMVRQYQRSGLPSGSQIRPAQSDRDTGVVISFECEAPEVTGTTFYPANTRSHAINPLNWKTDSTPADASLNLGACFTNKAGEITREVANFCGGYLDTERGVLKVTGISSADYPPIAPLLPEGAYHVYDYMFFYRNLQENVKLRIESKLGGLTK